MSDLSELLTAAHEKDPMTTRARAQRINGRIHFATIANYQAGNHAEIPDPGTLQALADAYGLSFGEVEQAALGSRGAGPWVAPPEVAHLTRRQQDAVTEMIRAIAAARGGERDGDSGTPPIGVEVVESNAVDGVPGHPGMPEGIGGNTTGVGPRQGDRGVNDDDREGESGTPELLPEE